MPGGDKASELLAFMTGMGSSNASADPCREPSDPGQTPELFSEVRGRLNGGRSGAELLLASASNVPVICSVEASILRDGAQVMKKAYTFEGAGRQGGVVKEAALGYEPDPYGDELTLSTACVPHLVWGGEGRRPALKK